MEALKTVKVTPTPDAALDTSHRRGRVVDMRRQRMTWDAIGTELGVSKQRAHKIYQEALAEYPVSALGEHRAEEAELIDWSVRRLVAIVEQEGADPATGKAVSARTRIEAINALRGLSEHRARLFGLNAPTRTSVEVITKDAFAADLERMAAELGNSDVIDAEEVPDERVKQLAKGAGEDA